MRTPTVLVVDDVVAIVEELLTLMRLHAISAIGALDLSAALAELEREPTIRVITCDVRLDRESGFDLIGLIRQNPSLCARDFQYLFVSGDQMQLEQLGHCSSVEILSKPVQPAILIGTVKRMLRTTTDA